jgi:hypothetical protein
MPMNNPGEAPLSEMPIPHVAGVLQTILGQRLPAYSLGFEDPKDIGRISRGEEISSELSEATIRNLAHVTETLLRRNNYNAEVVRAIMVGSSPVLEGDMTIVEFFREGQSERVVRVAEQL